MFALRPLLPVCSCTFPWSGTSDPCYLCQKWGGGSGLTVQSVSCSLCSWQSGEKVPSWFLPKVGSELHWNGDFSLWGSFPRPHDSSGIFMTWLLRKVFWRLSLADDPWDHSLYWSLWGQLCWSSCWGEQSMDILQIQGKDNSSDPHVPPDRGLFQLHSVLSLWFQGHPVSLEALRNTATLCRALLRWSVSWRWAQLHVIMRFQTTAGEGPTIACALGLQMRGFVHVL